MYPGARLRVEEDRDWVQTARDLMRPMAVGKRFYLVPAWRDDPAPEGRLRIAVNPGLAFGTGVHETTRLCLEALEDYLAPGMSVLDVGTGSGILAEAARLLGRGRCTLATRTRPPWKSRRVAASAATLSRLGGRGGRGRRRCGAGQHQPRSHCEAGAGPVARTPRRRPPASQRLRNAPASPGCGRLCQRREKCEIRAIGR